MNLINNHYSANIKLSLEPTIHGLINICLSFDAIVNRTIYIHETRLLLYILRFVNKQFMHLNTGEMFPARIVLYVPGFPKNYQNYAFAYSPLYRIPT